MKLRKFRENKAIAKVSEFAVPKISCASLYINLLQATMVQIKALIFAHALCAFLNVSPWILF